MEFLEVLTEGLERVLLVRGGGREVITIYSWPVRSCCTRAWTSPEHIPPPDRRCLQRVLGRCINLTFCVWTFECKRGSFYSCRISGRISVHIYLSIPYKWKLLLILFRIDYTDKHKKTLSIFSCVGHKYLFLRYVIMNRIFDTYCSKRFNSMPNVLFLKPLSDYFWSHSSIYLFIFSTFPHWGYRKCSCRWWTQHWAFCIGDTGSS